MPAIAPAGDTGTTEGHGADGAAAPAEDRPPQTTPIADNAGEFPLHRSCSAPPVARAPHTAPTDAVPAADGEDDTPPVGSADAAQAMAAASEVQPRRRRNQHNRGPGREAAKAARPRARQ